MTTPVKNQEQCGGGWLFSIVEMIESINMVAGKQGVPEGSVNELIYCPDLNNGCNGGLPENSINWIINQGGIDAAGCCGPYNVSNMCNCPACTPNPKLILTGTTNVNSNDFSLYMALTLQPIFVCVDATVWQNYNGGVLPASMCGENIDHCAQLTGYSPTQGGYWIVRNSWGVDWGINGFIWLQYGENTCGVTEEAIIGNCTKA